MSTSRNPDSLPLTDSERRLKDLLLDVSASIPPEAGRDAVLLRWAGGWVRDKLLGIDSHDIDTAINSMTGFSFCTALRAFCDNAENVTKHRLEPSDIGSLHKIAANPEKSKHLETVSTRIFGLDVDFVNLRRETYTEESRNPQMEFGSAEEDALRRDATINALFYNLQSGEIEDFTTGLPDLEKKLIRTPLAPLQTFMDDPLRVLRLIRFAARLDFTIDDGVGRVMSDGRVLEALEHKISRERIGVEMTKMLQGNEPYNALRLIDDLGLYHAILTNPTRQQPLKPDTSTWKAAYSGLKALTSAKSLDALRNVLLLQSKEAMYLAWVTATVLPWDSIPHGKSALKARSAQPDVVQVVREGLKAPSKVCDIVAAAHRNKSEIISLKTAVCTQSSLGSKRDRLGMAIRRWDARDMAWRTQVVYALLSEVMEKSVLGLEEDCLEVLQTWQDFLHRIGELALLDAPSLPRLVDGKRLSQALGIKPGPWMNNALDTCLAWQFRHPNETDAAAAIQEVMDRRQELGIPEN